MKNWMLNFILDNYEKLVYEINKSGKLYIYGKIKHTYTLLLTMNPSAVAYDLCLSILINKDIIEALLNSKHRYKYMQKFCRLMIEHDCNIHLTSDEESFEIKKYWEFYHAN